MKYSETYRYKVGCDLPGKYRVALDSDAFEFGGHGRVSKPLIVLHLFELWDFINEVNFSLFL